MSSHEKVGYPSHNSTEAKVTLFKHLNCGEGRQGGQRVLWGTHHCTHVEGRGQFSAIIFLLSKLGC